MNTQDERDEGIPRRSGALEGDPVEHVVDDEDLLARWSLGLLDGEERDQIIHHLDRCSECRELIGLMVENGAVELPEPAFMPGIDVHSANSDAAIGSPVSTGPAVSGPARRPLAVLVLAAGILLCVGALYWVSSESTPASLLAQAESDLKSGQAIAALDIAERLRDANLGESNAQRYRRLVEQAGEQAGVPALKAGDSGQVESLADRVSQLIGSSASMTNLRLQAKRGAHDPISLQRTGSLWEQGYDFLGSNDGFKGTPVNEALSTEFEKAIAEHSDSIELLLNQGHLLFESAGQDGSEAAAKLAQAKQHFLAALVIDPDNVDALLGLGLVHFKQSNLDVALDYFTKVVALNSDHLDGRLNTAICMERLEHHKEALPHWQRVVELAKAANEEELASQVESFLNSDSGPAGQETDENTSAIDDLLDQSR